MNDEQKQRLRESAEQLQNDIPLPNEIFNRIIEGTINEIENGSLGVDEGYEVTVEPVDGEVFNEAHTHLDGDVLTLHLPPGPAQDFEEYLNQFMLDTLMGVLDDLEDEGRL